MSPSPEPFSTTCWTQVIASRGQDTSASQALQQLCQDYYGPIKGFIKQVERRHGPESAEDLTQSFFAKVLQGNAFDGADRDQGRFRSYLLGAVKHFLAQEHAKRTRQRRGGGSEAVVLEDVEDSLPNASLSPEAAFDRHWANALLSRVLTHLEDSCASDEERRRFDALKPWLLGEAERGDQAALAQELGMPANTLKSHISRLRQAFRGGVRDEVARTLANPDLVEDEMQALLGALRKR